MGDTSLNMAKRPKSVCATSLFVLSCSITIPRKVLLQHLHSLDCHTAVYSLHHLTNLLALNEDDVIELLQKVPARDQQMQGKCVGL